LKKFLERYQGCRMKGAYEAGPSGFWLSDKLTTDGMEVLVVPPSLIPTESGNRVKTDRRDSRKLAKLLESNMLKRVVRTAGLIPITAPNRGFTDRYARIA
jgi:transposase